MSLFVGTLSGYIVGVTGLVLLKDKTNTYYINNLKVTSSESFFLLASILLGGVIGYYN